MKTPKTLTAVAALIALTACQQVPATDGSSISTAQAVPEAAAPDAPVAVAPIATPTATPTATPINLTYYSLVSTRAPVNGWATKTYTSTGSCVVYQSNTYCWDDGVKTLAWTDPMSGTAYGPYKYSYWNVGTWGGGQVSFNIGGVMETDLMTAPTLVTHNLEISLNSRAAPSTVLSTGTPHAVVCTENSGILNCNDFTIDLNQAHL